MLPRRARKRKPVGGGGGRGVGPRGNESTDAQRSAIGLVGEVVAYEWLRRHFAATPDAWVSTNRRFVFSDHHGDDGLGYDFRIPRGRSIDLFEVKATPGERYEIELSEGDATTSCPASLRARTATTFSLSPTRWTPSGGESCCFLIR